MGLFPKGAPLRFVLDVPPLSLGSTLPSEEIQPLRSPAYEDVPMWNILPSYQLYESTFSKNLDPDTENVHGTPPGYEDSLPSEPRTDYFSGSQPTTWENSILGNTHRLKLLALFDPQTADLLKIDVCLTTLPGQRGVKPSVYDALEYEFSQGSRIHGFVTIANTRKDPLPYDMVSIVFEGRITVNGDESDLRKPVVFYKFLNMFDYRASWTPAHLDETITPENIVDPVDGTCLQFSSDRYFQPGVVYKKFFNFTIPDKLLDCACEVHDLESHCQILPSIGLDKDQFLHQLRKRREKPAPGLLVGPDKSVRAKQAILGAKDFCFSDTAISYCVDARVVGKLSDYGGTASKDEYIMVKEGTAPVRVIPRVNRDLEDHAGRFYDKFVENIQQCIAMGKLLDGGMDPKVARRTSMVKRPQLYGGTQKAVLDRPQNWENLIPYKKKTLTHPPKVVGMLLASTPKREYVLQYQPLHCRSGEKNGKSGSRSESPVHPVISTLSCLSIGGISSGASSGTSSKNSSGTSPGTTLSLPLSVTYTRTDGSSAKPPEIKGVSAEIVCCTLRSKKYPIPVDFSTEMVVGDGSAQDAFAHRVTQPFGRYLKEVMLLSERYDLSQFNMTSQTVMDIKSLAHLGVKYNHVRIGKVGVKTAGGLDRWDEYSDMPGMFTKDFLLDIDVGSLAKEKAAKEDILGLSVCLVPTFQSCIAARFYYVMVYVKFSTGDPLTVKVGVKIQN